MKNFLNALSSSAPTPGGGGVAALSSALASALCSMVANLTDGKKKYAEYQADIERIIKLGESNTSEFFDYIQKDADAFEPLSKAYGIPKDTEGRAEILEKALLDAATTPLELIKAQHALVPIIEELAVKGSRLAISDVAVAATTLEAAAKSAIMNVYINTGLMTDKAAATKLNEEATALLDEISLRMNKVYEEIAGQLK